MLANQKLSCWINVSYRNENGPPGAINAVAIRICDTVTINAASNARNIFALESIETGDGIAEEIRKLSQLQGFDRGVAKRD